MIIVDEANFKIEVTNSEIPVLVDVSAVWCGPCKKQLDILEEFSKLNENKIKIVKVDADDSPHLIAELNVRSLPTLILFNKNQRVITKIGLTSLNSLIELEKYL